MPRMSLDFDNDGVPDVVVQDTNGDTIYVNIKWLAASLLTLITGGLVVYQL